MIISLNQFFLKLEGFPANTEFHPHGLYYFKEKGATRALLYVISHRSGGDVIDIFEVVSTTIRYVTSIQSSIFLNLNDLYVHPNGDIYVSSWQNYEPGTLMDTIEKYGRMPWNKLILCSKTPQNKFNCKVAIDGLTMPNGVNGYKNELYVVQTLARNIQVYEIDGQNLNFKRSIPTHSGCDNINIDEQGNLYIACHQKLLTSARHSKDHSILSPSQVLKLKQGKNEVEEVFYSDGGDLSGSSGAVVYKNKLVIGSVFEDGVLVCEGKY